MTDTLVGIQAQNIYLVNYITKLEFLLVQACKDRKREAKNTQKQISKVVKAIFKSEGVDKAKAVELYLGLVGSKTDSLKGSLNESHLVASNGVKLAGSKRTYQSLMFNYKTKEQTGI